MPHIGSQELALVVAVAALYVAVLYVALRDLYTRERVRGFNRNTWALIILVFNLFGIVAYWIMGREE